jgi:hypothetical protein
LCWMNRSRPFRPYTQNLLEISFEPIGLKISAPSGGRTAAGRLKWILLWQTTYREDHITTQRF